MNRMKYSKCIQDRCRCHRVWGKKAGIVTINKRKCGGYIIDLKLLGRDGWDIQKRGNQVHTCLHRYSPTQREGLFLDFVRRKDGSTTPQGEMGRGAYPGNDRSKTEGRHNSQFVYIRPKDSSLPQDDPSPTSAVSSDRKHLQTDTTKCDSLDGRVHLEYIGHFCNKSCGTERKMGLANGGRWGKRG